MQRCASPASALPAPAPAAIALHLQPPLRRRSLLRCLRRTRSRESSKLSPSSPSALVASVANDAIATSVTPPPRLSSPSPDQLPPRPLYLTPGVCRAQSRVVLQELYDLWFAHMWDNIWSVRETTAVALGEVLRVYGDEAWAKLMPVLKERLPQALVQPRESTKNGALQNVSTFGVVMPKAPSGLVPPPPMDDADAPGMPAARIPEESDQSRCVVCRPVRLIRSCCFSIRGLSLSRLTLEPNPQPRPSRSLRECAARSAVAGGNTRVKLVWLDRWCCKGPFAFSGPFRFTSNLHVLRFCVAQVRESDHVQLRLSGTQAAAGWGLHGSRFHARKGALGGVGRCAVHAPRGGCRAPQRRRSVSTAGARYTPCIRTTETVCHPETISPSSCRCGLHVTIRVVLWNPSHRSRVNSGQRFNRGFETGEPLY